MPSDKETVSRRARARERERLPEAPAVPLHARPPDLHDKAEAIVKAKGEELSQLVKTRIIESILTELANPIGPVAAYNESDNKA